MTGIKGPTESFHGPKLGQFEQKDKVALDHSPKYKISIYEFIPI